MIFFFKFHVHFLKILIYIYSEPDTGFHADNSENKLTPDPKSLVIYSVCLCPGGWGRQELGHRK